MNYGLQSINNNNTPMLGTLRYIHVYGMDTMSQAIPVNRPHYVNTDGDRVDRLMDILDIQNVPKHIYNLKTGVNEEELKKANVIEPSSNGEISWIPFNNQEVNVQSSAESALLPRASFLLATETRIQTPYGSEATVYYIRGYTDTFGNVQGNIFNQVFHNQTMFYVDNISVVTEYIDTNGLIYKIGLSHNVTLINGEFEYSVTQKDRRVLTADMTMLEMLSNEDDITGPASSIHKDTRVIDTRGANSTPTTFLKTLVDEWGKVEHDPDMIHGDIENKRMKAMEGLLTGNNAVDYNEIPLLTAIQGFNSGQVGYKLTPNYITLEQLRLLYPNIGMEGVSEVFRQSPPQSMTGEALLNNSVVSTPKAKIAYQVGLKVAEFLSKTSLYSVHMYMSPFIDRGGSIDYNEPAIIYAINGRSIYGNTTDELEQQVIEDSKGWAYDLLYRPFVTHGYYLTIELRADIRGVVHIWVGFNDIRDVMHHGYNSIDHTGKPMYNLEPYSTSLPIYSMSTIMPVIQDNNSIIHFTVLNDNLRQQGVQDYQFGSIDDAIYWGRQNVINDIPTNRESFKQFLSIHDPIISNTWRVHERSFTSDAEHVLSTATPSYQPNVVHNTNTNIQFIH